MGEGSYEEVSQLQDQMLQSSNLPEVESLQRTDPEGALLMAKSFSDPIVRIAAISTAMPGLARSNTKEASQVFKQEIADVDGLDDGPDKLHALVALAKSAYYVNDNDKFAALEDNIIDIGEAIFQTDHLARPEMRAGNLNGYEDLMDFVEFATSKKHDEVIDKIHTTNDPTLKPYLLLYAANGVMKEDPDRKK